MKQEIENIIKKNLPEKKEMTVFLTTGGGTGDMKGTSYKVPNTEWNDCLSKINTSLIADEVLKVVVEKIKEIKIKDGFSEISGSYNSACDKILLVLNK